MVVIGFVTKTPSNGTAALFNNSASRDEAVTVNPLDKFSSADIAVHVARMTNMDEAPAVANHANKVNTELAIIPVDAAMAAKPQIVASDIKSVDDVQEYVVQEGDTLSSLSTKFGVTSSSIRASNGLIGEVLSPGSRIKIPPVNGIIYTVQAGDTPESLARYYSSDATRIIAFNDAEVDGLKVGQQIVIPGGENPAPVYSGVTYSSYQFYSTDYTYIAYYTSYNPGVYGTWYSRSWCTDWASYRAAQLGNPVGNWGNANRWDNGARAAGYYVGSIPRVGAVLQTDSGWAGHVGVVEEVSADGTQIKFSDMNGLAGRGNAAKTKDWVPASNWTYIYR